MVYALVYCDGDEIYLYSTEEKAENALIQRMAEAVRDGDDLDFSYWKIVSFSLDKGEDIRN
jgi:hypothetical protein